jgi:hypothetical protein
VWASTLPCPAASLDFYDVFYAPGTRILMATSLLSLWGYDLTKATACTKIHNGTNTVSSHLYFLAFGTVFWTMGLVMLMGQVSGSSNRGHTCLCQMGSPDLSSDFRAVVSEKAVKPL